MSYAVFVVDSIHGMTPKLDKIFHMTRGNIAHSVNIVHLNALPLRRGTAEAQTVRGPTNSLISMSSLQQHRYIPIFGADKMSVYDGRTTTIKV
jgi:hypothetical protein